MKKILTVLPFVIIASGFIYFSHIDKKINRIFD